MEPKKVYLDCESLKILVRDYLDYNTHLELLDNPLALEDYSENVRRILLDEFQLDEAQMYLGILYFYGKIRYFSFKTSAFIWHHGENSLKDNSLVEFLVAKKENHFG